MMKKRKDTSIDQEEILYHNDIDLKNDNSAHTKIIKLTGKNKDVLEIGCSTGYMTKVLNEEMGCRITCIELNKDAADFAKPFCIDMIISDIETLDLYRALSDKCFDVIIMADVIEHLRHPNILLDNLVSFLKKKGFLLLSVPNGAHGSVALELLSGRWNYRDLGLLDRSHLHFYDKNTLEIMLDEAGYIVSHLDRVILHPKYTEFRQNGTHIPLKLRHI